MATFALDPSGVVDAVAVLPARSKTLGKRTSAILLRTAISPHCCVSGTFALAAVRLSLSDSVLRNPSQSLRGNAQSAQVAGEQLQQAGPSDGQVEESGENGADRATALLTGGDELTRDQLLWRAAKPPMYTVALIPVMVGAAAAYLESGRFFPGRFWSFLFHSVLVILWLNLSNDAFDAETGVDKGKKESVVNITGSRTGVLVAAFACLAVGGTGLLLGALGAGDPRVFQLLAAAIACGYVYQSPPFRLSYKGLGEPLCFIAFGPLATSAFYLFQAAGTAKVPASVGPTVLVASVLVGLTTTLILFCSHFHQIESDQEVGKMSPLVRLGTARGADVVRIVVPSLYAVAAAACVGSVLPWTVLACVALSLPVARNTVRFVTENHSDNSAIFMAKYHCIRLHTAFGFMLALGLVLGRLRIA